MRSVGIGVGVVAGRADTFEILADLNLIAVRPSPNTSYAAPTRGEKSL